MQFQLLLTIDRSGSHLCRLAPLQLRGLTVTMLLMCVGCQKHNSVEQTTSKIQPGNVAGKPEAYLPGSEHLYLAPFLPGQGVAVAFHRHLSMHGDGLLLDFYEPNVPFWDEESDIPPGAESLMPDAELAIWKDGTIIWSERSDANEYRYYEGKLEKEAVSRLLATIDSKEYCSDENMRLSLRTLDWGFLTSMIAVNHETNDFVFCCELDMMELTKEYWNWNRGKLMEYSFDTYSFQQFCNEVPESYSRFLRDYAGLRDLLWSFIPKERKRIELNKRIRWVVLPMQRSAGKKRG